MSLSLDVSFVVDAGRFMGGGGGGRSEEVRRARVGTLNTSSSFDMTGDEAEEGAVVVDVAVAEENEPLRPPRGVTLPD